MIQVRRARRVQAFCPDVSFLSIGATMLNRLSALCFLILGSATACYGQAVTPVPYDRQLPTDPDVGNVQGIQRYGRQLSTDPDVGTGFSYHVHPIGYIPVPGGTQGLPGGTQGLPAGWGMGGPVPQGQERGAPIFKSPKQFQGAPLPAKFNPTSPENRNSPGNSRTETAPSSAPGVPQGQPNAFIPGKAKPSLNENTEQVIPASYTEQPAPPVVAPPDSTKPAVPPAPAPASPAADGVGAPVQSQPRTFEQDNVIHQPLIQVKMRVVEVTRDDLLQAASVLDFVGQNPHPHSSLISSNNINNNMRNVSGGTRFSVTPPNLVGISSGALSGGAGALVNLTTGNLNWIASWLATEFHSDVLTAPEVVVLNGQTVELISGSKVPFLVGQNVITGQGQNIQQFFYKHVGTYISVTPQIVNWGKRAEGSGNAHLQESEIANWKDFVLELNKKVTMDKKIFFQGWPTRSYDMDADDAAKSAQAANDAAVTAAAVYAVADPKMLDKYAQLAVAAQKAQDDAGKAASKLQTVLAQKEIWNNFLQSGAPKLALTQNAKNFIVNQLAAYYSRTDLISFGLPICCKDGCNGCDWHAEDCTIDLSVVARFSATDDSSVTVPLTNGNTTVSTTVPIESNVRAISNIVQVKSGHGVVMGGVIGEQDLKNVSKVPILGDIPAVGALFRSKTTSRQKTELLIFIEAQVLPPCPEEARAHSYQDFRLGEGYVAGDFLDNPLERGMNRAGFGAYLPPHSAEEKVFWERLGRKVKKMATQLDDTFE